MKHALIVSHPNPDSFTLTMARAYQASAEWRGDTTVFRDLYGVGFNPVLADREIPRPTGFTAGDDVLAERALIGDADVFVFVYPFWFNSPPAMLKGYTERVFGLGFGYRSTAEGDEPLMTGRKMVSISSSGAPKTWVVETGAWAAECKLFDEYFATMCGLAVIDHLHFGDIIPGIRGQAVRTCAASVDKMFQAHFSSARKTAA